MPDTKTPLWKQLVGAATGAAVAFVVYHGYTFTSDRLTALVTLPQGSGIMDRSGTPTHVRPTGTWDSTTQVSSSSTAAVTAAESSSVAAQNSSDRVFLGPFGIARGLKKFFQFEQSTSSSSLPPIAVNAPASSAASSGTAGTAGIAPADAAMHLWPGSTASGSSWSESSFGVEPQPAVTRPLVTEVEWSSSSSAMSVEAVTDSIPAEPAYSAPVVSMKKHPGKLPQSGFGLDVLAVVAVGSVLGRKRAMKK